MPFVHEVDWPLFEKNKRVVPLVTQCPDIVGSMHSHLPDDGLVGGWWKPGFTLLVSFTLISSLSLSHRVFSE